MIPPTPKEARRRAPALPRVLPDPRCLCGKPAQRYSASSGRSYCWKCSLAANENRQTLAILFIDAAGVARIDRDRMGGGVTCAECGHELYDHPELPGATFLTVLCDGSVAKL